MSKGITCWWFCFFKTFCGFLYLHPDLLWRCLENMPELFFLAIPIWRHAPSVQLIWTKWTVHCTLGSIVQLTADLTVDSGVACWNPSPAISHESWNIFSSHSLGADSRRAVVHYWGKYVHLELVNCLGGLCLPRTVKAGELTGLSWQGCVD